MRKKSRERGHNKRNGCLILVDRILEFLHFVCCFLEMHLVKIMSFTIMVLCCSMVNALHLVVVFILLLCTLIGISTLTISFSIIGSLLSMIFLGNMIYQTDFVPKFDLSPNCSAGNITIQSIVETTILDTKWWGFILLKEGDTMAKEFKVYLVVFLIMTLQTIIRTRQKITRIDAGKPPDVPHVLFINTSRKDADKNLSQCLKFIINYGFYKFGVEITLSFCVFVIAFRKDIFSVLYAVWIVILCMTQRSTLSMIWPIFLLNSSFSILWQYCMVVGLSPKACFEYPWNNQKVVTHWFFLPSFNYPPNTSKILVDYVLLLLIQRQQAVFELERKYGDKYLGGSNKEVYMDYYNSNFVNPIPTGSVKSWLEVGKFLFMRCLFRVTLAFEFWTGASNANVLSLGYLVGAFVFLWIGYDLCLWHIKKILKWWNTLLGYTVFVILAKTLLEFAGCIYGSYLNENIFWLVQLLFISCSQQSPPHGREPSSFYWDVVCFTLVIFQRRYFKSYYFLHEVDDAYNVFRLQAKGAKLMDELQEYKLKNFQLRERKTLMKIKTNMNRIKAWQKRMQGLNYNEPTDHATAIYMGDYLMFEDIYELSSQIEKSSSSSDEYDYDDELSLERKAQTMSQFIENVLKRTGDNSAGRTIKVVKKQPSDHGKYLEREEKNSKDRKLSKGREDTDADRKKSILKSFRSEKDRSKASDIFSESPDSSDSEEKTKGRSKRCWRLFHSFCDSAMVSMIQFFNKHSKDYKFIESKMKAEREMQRQQPRRDNSRDRSSSIKYGDDRLSVGYKSRDEIMGERKRSFQRGQDSREDVHDPNKKSSQELVVNLIHSICMFVMSKTELLCYMIIFLHTAISPTLLSLPLPLLVFYWGSLTTIRPTTTFWTVLIAYTEVTVVIKALFQNSIFPWNSHQDKLIRAEYPPLFLGIHQDNQYVVADLFLLLLLFLHRYKLKALGLWNRTHEEETLLPQNLRLYRKLPSEKDFKDVKGNRSLVNQRRRLITELTDTSDSISHFLQMATWKCTSRATAKLTYLGNKVRTKILVKEIEGPILVTHEGRRLEPARSYLSQYQEDEVGGDIILRVYANEFLSDLKKLFYKLSWVQHFTSLRKFFVQILVRDWRVSADFYTLMFIFEFLDFLIVFFGFSSFTESVQIGSEDYFNLAENQVPAVYLFTVIAHFLVIIIDRILYLRKNVVGKLIFQFFLVTLVHIWMFIVVPIITESPFNRLPVPQTYYIICCYYFLMSAYQLRVGYPMRVQGHFLCKKYGYFNYYAYKGLQFIPFFNQLRTLLDFLCIHSSLTMSEWVKMESMFRLVFENKCSRRADIHNPAPRGEKCPKNSKYPLGVSVLTAMIIVIWLPFILFAFFNTVAQPNLPQEVSLDLQLGNFGQLFSAKSTFLDITGFSESDFQSLQSLYKYNRKIWSFLSLFDYRDVAVIKFRFEPYKPWAITPQELRIMNNTLQNLDIPVSLYFIWHIQRIPRSQIVASAKGYIQMMLNKSHVARRDLAGLFLNESHQVYLPHFLPKFIHITNEGEAKPVKGFLSAQNHTNPYRNVTLKLEYQKSIMLWKLEELFDDAEEGKIRQIPYGSQSEITIYTFNEKNIPKLLLNVSKKGIFGLYISIVLVLWTLVKRIMCKYPYIMFDNMPNPDQVLKLCQDIYLARENQEFALEEDLYAKLLFLFRSPETMIRVTKLNTQT